MKKRCDDYIQQRNQGMPMERLTKSSACPGIELKAKQAALLTGDCRFCSGRPFEFYFDKKFMISLLISE